MSYIANPGDLLRSLRKKRQETLSKVGLRSNIPVSTLSKIENGKISPTYDQLLRLSNAMEVDIAELFTSSSKASRDKLKGRRSINRVETGKVIKAYGHNIAYLSTDLLHKEFTPILADVSAKSLKDNGPFTSHPGEEFVYVLSGTLILLTELYSPLTLTKGESIYFDGAMKHAYLTGESEPCQILSICSVSKNEIV